MEELQDNAPSDGEGDEEEGEEEEGEEEEEMECDDDEEDVDDDATDRLSNYAPEPEDDQVLSSSSSDGGDPNEEADSDDDDDDDEDQDETGDGDGPGTEDVKEEAKNNAQKKRKGEAICDADKQAAILAKTANSAFTKSKRLVMITKMYINLLRSFVKPILKVRHTSANGMSSAVRSKIERSFR